MGRCCVINVKGGKMKIVGVKDEILVIGIIKCGKKSSLWYGILSVGKYVVSVEGGKIFNFWRLL